MDLLSQGNAAYVDDEIELALSLFTKVPAEAGLRWGPLLMQPAIACSPRAASKRLSRLCPQAGLGEVRSLHSQQQGPATRPAPAGPGCPAGHGGDIRRPQRSLPEAGAVPGSCRGRLPGAAAQAELPQGAGAARVSASPPSRAGAAPAPPDVAGSAGRAWAGTSCPPQPGVRPREAQYHLGEYEAAKAAFEAASAAEPSHAGFRRWLRKCEDQLRGAPGHWRRHGCSTGAGCAGAPAVLAGRLPVHRLLARACADLQACPGAAL